MRRGRRQSMPSVPIPTADTSGYPVKSQVPPAPPPPQWTSGTIRETCSCGASIEVPATSDGRETVADWRRMHLHMRTPDQHECPPQPYQPEQANVTVSNDRQPAVGEIRDNETQDVPFGFFPPVVEARQP